MVERKRTRGAGPSTAQMSSQEDSEKLTRPVCIFFKRGFCRNGDNCRFRHDVPSTSGEPQDSDTHECGICYEYPGRKNGRYGLLTGCDHSFCLSCIRTWRSAANEDGSRNPHSSAQRTCPICRKKSNFVVPSLEFATGAEKRNIIAAFKKNLSQIPCKYFTNSESGETASCPFGNSCFYLHIRPNGTVVDKEANLAIEQKFSSPRRSRGRWPSRSRSAGRGRLLDGLYEVLAALDDADVEFLENFHTPYVARGSGDGNQRGRELPQSPRTSPVSADSHSESSYEDLFESSDLPELSEPSEESSESEEEHESELEDELWRDMMLLRFSRYPFQDATDDAGWDTDDASESSESDSDPDNRRRVVYFRRYSR